MGFLQVYGLSELRPQTAKWQCKPPPPRLRKSTKASPAGGRGRKANTVHTSGFMSFEAPESLCEEHSASSLAVCMRGLPDLPQRRAQLTDFPSRPPG